ncbi:hypothetical protein J6590_029193 [Homalodisca vitripennis]|nr:hypothetical protein J6590_029193 [Homalodisca vitripennis]
MAVDVHINYLTHETRLRLGCKSEADERAGPGASGPMYGTDHGRDARARQRNELPRVPQGLCTALTTGA